MHALSWLGFLLLVLLPFQAVAELDLDKAASHFGLKPGVWGMRLSPDGEKVSFLRQHSNDFPIAMVIDLRTGKANLALASDPKKNVDITRCEWANESRLLCGYYGVWRFRGDLLPSTRLVAVDADGSNIKVLAQKQQRGNFALYQDEIVDRLPDESKHIWIEFDEGRGQGVSRVDIYKNKLRTVEKPKETVWGYWSDGHGQLRIRMDYDKKYMDYQYRLSDEKKWRHLHRSKPEDLQDDYSPAGFGEAPNDLLVWDKHEGRRALFSEKLAKDPKEPRSRKLVYAHDEVDIDGTVSIGKYNRLVGVSFQTDKPYVEFFDETLKTLHDRVAEDLSDSWITFVDESWDRRYYLIRAGSDTDAGAYYRFDTETDTLVKITALYPWLEDFELAPMKPLRFQAEDGVSIPGYLTKPSAAQSGPRPLVVLPHGGPEARDDWGFSWLPQFLAARGYVVLQANYRGSGGYGDAWTGAGAFNDWKRAMEDIEAGVKSLVEQGIADPDRMCIVGWSYGGYAALISAIEFPNRYRCVVSVAGVSHPHRLYKESTGLERRSLKSFIPRDGQEIRKGSPWRRAAEMPVPVLLFHGDMDINVDIGHSKDMEKALRKKDKPVEFITYEGADHGIRRQKDRIDLLQRMGVFLDEHLAAKPKATH